MGTSIWIERDSGWVDRARAYRVLLNGQEIGRLKNGESRTFEIAPGTHLLQLKIDWCGSNAVAFTVAAGQNAQFLGGSNLRGFRVLLASIYILFARNGYLWLKPAGK